MRFWLPERGSLPRKRQQPHSGLLRDEQVVWTQGSVAHPADDLLSRAQGLPPHIVVGPQAFLSAVHQARIAHDTQVVRNPGLLQGTALHDLDDAYFSFVSAEQTQYAQARRICQCL